MLRLTSLGSRLSALGFSAAFHAAVLFTSAGHSSVPQNPSDAVGVEVLTLAEAPVESPEPARSRQPEGRATTWPAHTHSYPVPASHDLTPHNPSLVHLPANAADARIHAPADAAPHFTIVVGAASDSHSVVSTAGVASRQGEQGEDVAPIGEESVDVRAHRMSGSAPAYPTAARADGIEGDVRLEVIVGMSGVVESARVIQAVGHGLDEAALAAIRQYRFSPAMKDGHAVRVRMVWPMAFRLR